jgi:hypothetical protein
VSETLAPQQVTPRGEILQTAHDAIHGDRNIHYGTPTENFERIAELWSSYLRFRQNRGFHNIMGSDVAQMMILLKVARGVNNMTQDTAVDIAGYAACGWESYKAWSDTPF